MKISFLLSLLFICLCVLFINPSYADVCSIPEGTYVGKALVQNVHGGANKIPLFIIVANNRITGFYAPEDQNPPQGASINQTEVNSGFNFFITTTSRGDFLNFNVSGLQLPTGKAKKINPKTTLGFHGYYIYEDTGGFFIAGSPGDFLNVSASGTLVARVTAFMNFNFFFGRVNNEGGFEQIFPEKGPRLDIDDIDDTEANLDVRYPDGKSASTRFLSKGSSTCNVGTTTEGDLANELLISSFKENLDAYLNSFSDLSEALEGKFDKKESFVAKFIKGAIDSINQSGKKVKPKECNSNVKGTVNVFKRAATLIEEKLCSVNENKEKCIADEVAFSFIQNLQSIAERLASAFNTDDNENGITDLCD